MKVDDRDMEHLYELARKEQPAKRTAAAEIRANIGRVLEGFTNAPVYAVDRYWNVMSTNAIAEYVFAIKIGSNCLEEFFTRQPVALHYPPREPAGRLMAPLLRHRAGLFHGEPMVESTAVSTISLQLLGMNASIGFIRILIATAIAGCRHELSILAYTVAVTSGLRYAEQGLARGFAGWAQQAAFTMGTLIARTLALTCSADKLPNPKASE